MRDGFICPLGSNFLCTHFLSRAISSIVNGAAIGTPSLVWPSLTGGDCVQVKKRHHLVKTCTETAADGGLHSLGRAFVEWADASLSSSV